jgi:hypothetical protein
MKQTTKQKLNIVWAWFKKWGWAIAFALSAIALFFLLGKNRVDNDSYKRLLEGFQEREREYDRQVRELARIRAQEEQKQIEILARYNEMLLAIEELHDERLKEVARMREGELKEIIAESRKDPKEMQRRLNEVFGIQVYQQK